MAFFLRLIEAEGFLAYFTERQLGFNFKMHFFKIFISHNQSWLSRGLNSPWPCFRSWFITRNRVEVSITTKVSYHTFWTRLTSKVLCMDHFSLNIMRWETHIWFARKIIINHKKPLLSFPFKIIIRFVSLNTPPQNVSWPIEFMDNGSSTTNMQPFLMLCYKEGFESIWPFENYRSTLIIEALVLQTLKIRQHI